MAAISASQSRAANSTSVLSTALRSNVERLMIFSTSDVAVCCWSDSRKLVEQASILDRNHRLLGEVVDQLDLLVSERPNFLTIDANSANNSPSLSIGHGQKRPRARHLDDGTPSRVSLECRVARS